MYSVNVDDLVSAYVPLLAVDPAAIDAGHIVSVAWLLYVNLRPFLSRTMTPTRTPAFSPSCWLLSRRTRRETLNLQDRP